MSVQRIASRYAKSLIELANEQDQLEPVTEDMHSLKAMMANRDLYLLFKSPVVPTEKKKQIFATLFKDRLSAMTSGFLGILTTKGREAYMPDVVEEYIKQYKRLKRISTVKLTTAVKLDEQMLQAIHDKIKASGATDEKIEMTSNVDPDLVGGFVLEFEDKIYDASISNKLEELKRQFRDNVYVSQIIAR
jgi:F-type H+-transporting ATPase subunit delta